MLPLALVHAPSLCPRHSGRASARRTPPSTVSSSCSAFLSTGERPIRTGDRPGFPSHDGGGAPDQPARLPGRRQVGSAPNHRRWRSDRRCGLRFADRHPAWSRLWGALRSAGCDRCRARPPGAAAHGHAAWQRRNVTLRGSGRSAQCRRAEPEASSAWPCSERSCSSRTRSSPARTGR